MSKDASPSADLLDSFLIVPQRGVPLHAQVQSVLQEAIDLHFEDGQTFWTEMLLMERLGVSRNTVRRALDELVREGLLITNSTRNRMVRKTNGFNTVVLFHQRYNSDYIVEMLQYLAHVCDETGLELRPFYTQGGERTPELVEKFDLPVRSTRVVLFDTPERNLGLYRVLSQRGYRSVLLDSYFPGFKGSYVGTDTHAVIHVGLQHLFELGHRRIVLLVNEPSHIETVRTKMKTFAHIMRENGIEEGRIYICDQEGGHDSFEVAYAAMDDVWAHQPTAIFTLSDPGAWAVLKWCAENKIEVPGQVSVLGFEGVRPSKFTHPALSTVAHPIEAIARQVIEVLRSSHEQQLFLAPHLIVRESTGRVGG